MEKNGKSSISKRKKHIKIIYYFVTYCIEKYELSLESCPIADMIGDFMTKPIQGAAFNRFGGQVMGVIEAQDPCSGKLKNIAMSK